MLSVYDHGLFFPYVPEHTDIPVVDRSVSWYSGRRALGALRLLLDRSVCDGQRLRG